MPMASGEGLVGPFAGRGAAAVLMMMGGVGGCFGRRWSRAAKL